MLLALDALEEDTFVCLMCIKSQSCLYKCLNNLCFQLFFSFIDECMKPKGLALYVCVCVCVCVCACLCVCVCVHAHRNSSKAGVNTETRCRPGETPDQSQYNNNISDN